MGFWMGVTCTLMAMTLALIIATETVLIKTSRMLKEMEVKGNAETMGE